MDTCDKVAEALKGVAPAETEAIGKVKSARRQLTYVNANGDPSVDLPSAQQFLRVLAVRRCR